MKYILYSSRFDFSLRAWQRLNEAMLLYLGNTVVREKWKKRPVSGIFVALVLLIGNLLQAEEWKLTGGTGKKLPDGVLEVSGNGTDSNAWVSDSVDVKPGEMYRFFMEACSPTGSGGCAPCGLEGFSRDFSEIDKTWKPYSFIFKAPTDRKEFRMRIGQWNSAQTYRFRKMKVEPVEPIYRGIKIPGDGKNYFLLGDGEMIRGGKYRFNGFFGGQSANALRPFVSTTTGFNSNRFTVYGEQEIVFLFSFPSINGSSEERSEDMFSGRILYPLKSRRIEVNVNYHVRGECIVLATGWTTKENSWNPLRDQETLELGRIDKVGTIQVEVPESFCSGSHYLRLTIRGSKDASFQVDGVNFEADVDCKFEGVGETVFADVLPQPEKSPDGYSSKPLFFDEQRTLYVLHSNDSDKPVKPLIANPPSRMSRQHQSKYSMSEPFDAQKGEIPPQSACLETKPKSKVPEYRIPLSDRILKYSFLYQPYRDADFGYCIPGDILNAVSNEGDSKPLDGIWWAESDWKVSPDKMAPERKPDNLKSIFFSAAKNDIESFQLVVNGTESGRENVQLLLDGDLKNESGATIPAKKIQIRYAYYHFIQRPTDSTGMMGFWPDALPPHLPDGSIDIPAGKNQPFWITVSVPENAEAEIYEGRLKLRWTQDGLKNEQTIPFTLKVWNFALPKRNTLQTAFGRNIWRAFEYHNAKNEEDRRAVLEFYHQLYADHRISVYDPAPLDPIRVSWDKENLKAKIDFSDWDKEMQRLIDKFHITGFRLHIQGMGWGTFEERGLGNIAGFEEGTPQYEALFSDYVKQLESHLQEKGWLNMAYIYWFDEPEPKDYEFVANGFTKLQKHAPGLARMITEEPNPGFIEALEKVGAKIDIWCPVTYNFDENEAKKRQELGERFWWYVCCGPHAPFCTLFIDHPSIELRLWHWQAWKYNVVGSLIWESNYWTSPTAFPQGSENPYQNPYDDPMSYVSGGPQGSKRFWGNGDGRFVYPPLEAAIPGRNDGKPILKAPVSSIRLEMLREGIEDYEMLNMLRKLKKKHPEAADKIDVLLVIPAEITSSLTDFTTDPKPIYQRRQRVAELIEKLSE